MKILNIKDSWGSWTINNEPIIKYLGAKIQQGSTTGILRFSHSTEDRGHGGSTTMNSYVLVTEEFRLVRLRQGEATLVEEVK